MSELELAALIRHKGLEYMLSHVDTKQLDNLELEAVLDDMKELHTTLTQILGPSFTMLDDDNFLAEAYEDMFSTDDEEDYVPDLVDLFEHGEIDNIAE